MADFPRLSPPETTRPDQTVLCRHASGRPTRDPAPRSSPGPSGLPLPSGTFFPRRLSALAPIYDAHFTTGAIEQQLVHMPPGRQKKASPIGRVPPEALPRLPSQAIARPHDAATLGNRARVEPRLDPTHTVLAVEAGGQRIDDVFLGGKLRIREKSPKILLPGGTGGHNMPPARHRAAKAPRASARSAKKRARSEACPSAPRSGILHSSCRRSWPSAPDRPFGPQRIERFVETAIARGRRLRRTVRERHRYPVPSHFNGRLDRQRPTGNGCAPAPPKNDGRNCGKSPSRTRFRPSGSDRRGRPPSG